MDKPSRKQIACFPTHRRRHGMHLPSPNATTYRLSQDTLPSHFPIVSVTKY